jgi:predicted RNA-binding Zn ribbon-like protein
VTDHLFIEFVNSELFDGRGNREDRLEDPGWRRAFLERWGLPVAESMSPSDLHDLTALRSDVRSMVDAVATGGRPNGAALQRLDTVLADHPVRFRLRRDDAGEPELEPVPLSSDAADVIAGEVALSTARFLVEDDIRRLKACDNAGCRWVFTDETKNRIRRWCRQCGNVDRVRRFRERQRLARDRGSERP